tara:strand:- start:3841 stop:4098 length:258 start_codon:yes stop_codon:yes gene_type:complete
VRWILIILLTGCSISTTEKKLLIKDKENKKLEIMYLNEIRSAQENNDSDAFQYFFEEYLKVERLQIPEHLKKDKSYFEGGINYKY